MLSFEDCAASVEQSLDLLVAYLYKSAQEELALSRLVHCNKADRETRRTELVQRFQKKKLFFWFMYVSLSDLLVEPAVAGRVHLVQLGHYGPDGFVGEVIHQLLHKHEQGRGKLHVKN
jgi:hypothetical protein